MSKEMEQTIMQAIEAEVDRRVSDRLSAVLQHISKTYRISYERLMKETSTIEVGSCICLGFGVLGKRCTRPAKFEGYCNLHKDQKPIVRMRAEVSDPDGASPVSTHTHTLPPFFLAGCPACEKVSSRPRLNI
jgi:Family of unknown function (DUF5763)